MARLQVRGYTDRPNYRPGDEVTFYVSSEHAGRATGRIVRLRHGDPDPTGPGIREEQVDGDSCAQLSVRPQSTDVGGCVVVPTAGAHGVPANELSLHLFVWPTTPHAGRQVLASSTDAATGEGWTVVIEDGSPQLQATGSDGSRRTLLGGGPVFPEVWYSIALSHDATGELRLDQRAVVNSTNSRLSRVVDIAEHYEDRAARADPVFELRGPLLFAAEQSPGSSEGATRDHFNGKLDSPALVSGALTEHDLASLRADSGLAEGRYVARWDFGHPETVDTDRVADVSGGGLDGTCVNQPDRAMTGWNWRGIEEHFVHAPHEYGALWFHADSLDDCRWEPTTTWRVPDNLRSGAYALEVTFNGTADQIPFFVVPRQDQKRAPIALLLPTFSYLAYANSQVMQNAPVGQTIMGVISVLEDIDLELHESRGEYGLSTYDHHLDGGGVAYSSWRRPILNLRPRYRHEFGSVWQFPADLHLIDWLDELGFDYDVITDHDLAAEGADLLKRYNAVITGTHPEYYSGEMLDAWEEFLATGGRGMYLAGNGFYWITSQHPDKPWVIEVRKGEQGDQAWRARPGELFHSTTGERGGLWRMRARAPQKLFGTGFIAHGLDRSTGYYQLPDARDQRTSWITEGIDDSEIIGNFGLVNGGASGLEVDCVNYTLGTPPNAQLLASSRGHSLNAQLVPEEQMFAHAGSNGVEDPAIRADIVYFTTKAGGAMFSTSSMAWCGSLSHNDYDNNVSTMTANVLRRFADPQPLPPVE